MENIKYKLTLLSQIAKELNNRNLTWAIGASMLLYFKGIVSEFQDIDIMVTEDEIAIVKEVLLAFGKLQAPKPNVSYKTKHFLEFQVNGVDIDIMAGFVILNEDQEHHFPLKKEHIQDFTELNGIRIPLQSLAEWRTYYQLMGRTEKVNLIDAWQQTHVY
ncbi:MAG: hypothetical protein WCI30_00695 [Clostridia bacterium]